MDADRMSSAEFVGAYLLNGYADRFDRDLEGNLDLHGSSENNRLVFDELDLENTEIYGSVHICNITFTGDLNFYHAIVHGEGFILENLIIDGDLSLPENIMEMASEGKRAVHIRNVQVKGQIQFSHP